MSNRHNLRAGSTFLAEGPLLCRVHSVRKGVAYCFVENGGWSIGFDTSSGLSCEEGTDERALPQAVGKRILIVGRFGDGDYNDRIVAAEARLRKTKPS